MFDQSGQDREQKNPRDGRLNDDGIYIRVMTRMRGRLRELKGARLNVLICIALHWDGRKSWPSLATIERETGLGHSTVCAAVKWLEANGWVSVERRINQANTYRIVTSYIQMGSAKIELPPTAGSSEIEQGSSEIELLGSSEIEHEEEPSLEEETTEEDSSLKQESREPEKNAPGFLEFYSIYPRQDGRSAALSAWNARMKEVKAAERPELVRRILTGATHYAAFHQAKCTEMQFIKQPATFLSKKGQWWEEWQAPGGPNGPEARKGDHGGDSPPSSSRYAAHVQRQTTGRTRAIPVLDLRGIEDVG